MTNLFRKKLTSQNQVALINENESISYRELIKQSDKIKKEIESNSIVLLIADNSSAFVVGYVAFLSKEKTINILVDNSFSDEFIVKIIKSYKPNYIYVSKTKKYFEKKYKNILDYDSYIVFKTSFFKVNFPNNLVLITLYIYI